MKWSVAKVADPQVSDVKVRRVWSLKPMSLAKVSFTQLVVCG